jgi:DNA-binding NarL/FixJ family response regulator
MHDERSYGERALRNGASGFVRKDQGSQTILTAIRQVLDENLFFSETLVKRVLTQATRGQSSVRRSPIDALSDREIEILTMLGQGWTSERIADSLFLSRSTVGTYRERLKSKLQLANCNELMRFAIRWVEFSTSGNGIDPTKDLAQSGPPCDQLGAG